MPPLGPRWSLCRPCSQNWRSNCRVSQCTSQDLIVFEPRAALVVAAGGLFQPGDHRLLLFGHQGNIVHDGLAEPFFFFERILLCPAFLESLICFHCGCWCSKSFRQLAGRTSAPMVDCSNNASISPVETSIRSRGSSLLPPPAATPENAGREWKCEHFFDRLVRSMRLIVLAAPWFAHHHPIRRPVGRFRETVPGPRRFPENRSGAR